MVMSDPDGDSILIRAEVAGTAMPTRISTGITVQVISALVLWLNLAGVTPRDLRCRMMDVNIAVKTSTPITMQTQRMIMCSS